MSEFRVHVGIDWAHAFHYACAVDQEGKVLFEGKVEHTAEDLANLCAKLSALVEGDLTQLVVGIETPHGIVVETLLDRGVRVFVINPKQLDRFRDRFAMSGAKDDRRDARALADAVRTDRRAFRELVPDADGVVQIRELSRLHGELQQEYLRQTSRLRDQLWRYFPAFVKLTEKDPGEPWALEVWKLIPTPEKAKTTQARSVQKILKAHRIRRVDGQRALQILREPAMTVSTATVQAARRHIATLSKQLVVLNAELRNCKKELEQCLENFGAQGVDEGKAGEQRVVEIANSMPGIGPIILGALLAEAARQLIAGDYEVLRSLSGVAPVTKSSGRSRTVMRRYGHNKRLGNALFNAAWVATQKEEVFKAKYQALRKRGHTHGCALRAVGDRWLSVLCAMIRSSTTYDPARKKAA